jgi:precorrin-6B methylase 2
MDTPQFKSTENEVQELSRAVRKLALIGAGLKNLNTPGVDPLAAQAVGEAVRKIFGDGIDTLDESERSTLINVINMGFAEAGELLNNPGRSQGWQVTDPVLLQTQGRSSGQVFWRIRALAVDRPLLQEALQGRFLDVGTGVAGIALEAARTCPTLKIDGIDIWEPALALAHENVKDSPYSDRIAISKLDVTELPEAPQYSLVWLPTMFMRRAVVEIALDRITAALRPNAYVIAARYTVPAAPEAAAFTALRTFRSGGEPIAQAEMEDMLRRRGLVDVESDVRPLATFTLGRFE